MPYNEILAPTEDCEGWINPVKRLPRILNEENQINDNIP